MQQTIKNTTTDLLASLPEEHVYYSPSDFKNAGFPEYLIQRILLEVDRNLAESVSLPESDWVDMKADNVQEAWNQFLSAIKAESRVPASYAHSVVESALEDIVDQLTQPRCYVLDTLIGEKSATIFQIQSRKNWIVSNPILAEALIRYMQRKEMDSITREKALQVISHVDDKLAENYTPLKWAQHLESVFTLLQNEVPSALFVRFFNDRNMGDYAKWIDMGPEFLPKTAFIERISTVGMLPDVDTIENVPESISNFESEAPAASIADLYENTDDEVESPSEPTSGETTFEDINSFETTPKETFESEEPILDETPPFDLQEESASKSDHKSTSDDIPEVISLDDVLAEESEFETESQPLFAQFLSKEDETEANNDEIQDDLQHETLDDAPFSFETESDQKIQDEPLEELDEPEDTPPIIDASSDDEHVVYLTDRAKRLLDLLEPNFETFIVEVFLNDELDFYKHLENIVAYDQWRSAGRYITRDIFDRNRIDLYSEPAVMFTDVVQEFFDQNA